MVRVVIELPINEQLLGSMIKEENQSVKEGEHSVPGSEHSVQGSEHSVQVSEHSRSSNGRSAAGAFLKKAIKSLSSSLSQAWKSTSPQPISNVELNQDLLPPQDSDAGAPGGPVETECQYILTLDGVDQLIRGLASDFRRDFFVGDDRELAGAIKTPAGKALDVFFHACLWQAHWQGKDLDEVDVDALCFDLLSDNNRADFQTPGLQNLFQADCANLYHAHNYQFPDQQIQQAIQKNVRLWTKANLMNCAPEKKQALKQQFLDQVSLDLNGRPSEETESVGLFSTPDEESVSQESLASGASFAGMTVAHESLASRGSLNSRAGDGVNDAGTPSASFDSISFHSSVSRGPYIPAARPADPFLSNEPGEVPANLLAFDTNPEMYSLWRLLNNTHGPVANLGLNERNIATFNLLLGQGPSPSPIPGLQRAFQHDRDMLQNNLRGQFESGQIDVAITYHIQNWLKENQAGPTVDDEGKFATFNSQHQHDQVDLEFANEILVEGGDVGPARSAVHKCLDRFIAEKITVGREQNLTERFGPYLFRDEAFIEAWGHYTGLTTDEIKKDLAEKIPELENAKADLSEWLKVIFSEAKTRFAGRTQVQLANPDLEPPVFGDDDSESSTPQARQIYEDFEGEVLQSMQLVLKEFNDAEELKAALGDVIKKVLLVYYDNDQNLKLEDIVNEQVSNDEVLLKAWNSYVEKQVQDQRKLRMAQFKNALGEVLSKRLNPAYLESIMEKELNKLRAELQTDWNDAPKRLADWLPKAIDEAEDKIKEQLRSQGPYQDLS